MSLAKANDFEPNNPPNKKFDLLIDKISAPAEIGMFLNNIYCAENIDDARQKAKNLACNESIITKDGVWLNSHWFTVNSSNLDNDSNKSVLAREQDIKTLISDIENLEQSLSKLKQDLVDKKSGLAELKATKDDRQREVRTILQSISEVKSEISREESKLEEQRNRLFKIEQDITETIKHIEIDGSQVKSERAKLEQAMVAMESLSQDKSALQSQGDELKARLKDVRREFDQHKDKLHGSELGLQKAKQQVKHLTEELGRLEKQKNRLTQERALLTEKIISFDEPIECLKERLELSLAEKEEQQVILCKKTEAHEQANQKLISIEKEINILRRQHEQLRDENESLKIKQHEVSTKLASINEQILDKELNIEEVIKKLPDDLSQGRLRNLIRDLKQQIEELGPVNLTAIEEYTTESERKKYLDAQQNDLIEALTALEEAIAQIDHETKTRFKETFDFVNEQFQYLFPKIFGGGRAILSLSGEDLLDTGVTVMAQPPGKRNSSIQLLSGGEKALTAIALVFSIFRLNPAPFCMLDEVDAPLDDANVARYCNMVKEMSSDIQFIFITHNKVTMTMAEHLVGVTQHELGVSRLVAVDVDEASKMIEE